MEVIPMVEMIAVIVTLKVILTVEGVITILTVEEQAEVDMEEEHMMEIGQVDIPTTNRMIREGLVATTAIHMLPTTILMPQIVMEMIPLYLLPQIPILMILLKRKVENLR